MSITATDPSGPSPFASPDEVADLVRAVAAGVLGRSVDVTSVDVAPMEWGPASYACEVVTDDRAWDQPLIVRVAMPDDPQWLAVDGGEAAWHDHLAAYGIGVPPLVASGAGHGDRRATIMGRTHPHNLVELLAGDVQGVADLLGRAGRLHVAVHQVPTDGAPPELGSRDPVADAAADAERFDLAAEHAWLVDHRPAAAPDPVVCHGNLQLAQIRLEPADPDLAVITSWTAVTVDARERDVAHTSLALWAIPHLAPRRSDRMMLKLFRDTMIGQYQAAYAEAAGVELDADVLAYWTGAHVLDWAIRVGRRLHAAHRDPWEPAYLVARPEAFAKDLRSHFWDQVRTVSR